MRVGRQQMRAIVASTPGEPDVLELREVPRPEPGPGEILVKTRLAAVNFADVNRRRGTHADVTGGSFPLIPGLETMGTIARLGSGVSGYAIGQRVAAFARGGSAGSYCEYVVAPAEVALAIPDAVSDEQAAAFPIVGLTAYHLLASVARSRPEDFVLITAAAGGVGTSAIQIGRLLGLARILAAAGSPGRSAHAVALGATHGIDYSKVDLGAAAMAATGGRGVDVVIDAVGGTVRARAYACLAPLGRLVHYGNASGSPEEMPSELEQRSRLIGTSGFSIKALRRARPDLIRASAERILGWMVEGRLRIEVQEVLPLAAAAEAHRRLESRRVTGKLLLRVD